MYLLLLGIHAIFIACSHFFGYYVLEIIFILLGAFFFLYFSPFFFPEGGNRSLFGSMPSFSLSLSPEKSLIFPLILAYIGLYLLVFALTGSLEESFHLHVFILLGIYGIIFSYMMLFSWKNELFFDITRLHSLISVGTIVFLVVTSFFLQTPFSWSLLILSLSVVVYMCLALLSSEEKPYFFNLGIVVCIIGFYGALSLLFSFQGFSLFVGISLIFSVLFFEILPKIHVFSRYILPGRVFTLILSILSTIILLVLGLYEFQYLSITLIGLFFFAAVHVRYCNYVALTLTLGILYFLYSLLFFPLLQEGSMVSSLLFVFFLPLCIIGNTYFWDEKHPYDFSFLHYSGTAFSIIFSLYSLFFLPWGGSLYFMLSASIFLVSLLFFLSYFRFRFR